MTYSKSMELSSEIQARQVEPPPVSRRRRSIKEFLKLAVPIVIVTSITVIGLWYFIGFQLWYIAFVLIASYALYRPYYRWSHNHLVSDPNEGVLYIEDHSHPFILFFVTGSNPDQIPLDDINFDTPTRSFVDRYIFHCCTLIAGDRVLKGVRYVEELAAIKKYQESIKKQALDMGKQQVSVQLAILQTLESIDANMDKLVTYLMPTHAARAVVVSDDMGELD